MKTFQIEIEETLSKIIEITAASAEEAMVTVEEMYGNEDIVLTSSDFISSDIRFID